MATKRYDNKSDLETLSPLMKGLKNMFDISVLVWILNGVLISFSRGLFLILFVSRTITLTTLEPFVKTIEIFRKLETLLVYGIT
jgi:hypothetical protein